MRPRCVNIGIATRNGGFVWKRRAETRPIANNTSDGLTSSSRPALVRLHPPQWPPHTLAIDRSCGLEAAILGNMDRLAGDDDDDAGHPGAAGRRIF